MFPEYELLAVAAGHRTDPAQPCALDPIDWERLLQVAAWHRLTPLLYRYVRLVPELGVPVSILSQLHDAYSSTAAANVNLRRELDRVAGIFRDAGVPIIVLKGMALLETVYGELALRPMADLDLLVPEGDFPRAGKLLEVAGYDGYQGFTASADGPWRGAFVKRDGTAGVDLHRHVGDSIPQFDVGTLWERAVPSTRGDYFLLGPTDQLLHLALHFMQHRDRSSRDALGQLADIDWLIDLGVDWAEVVQRVNGTATRGRIFLTLSAVDRVFRGRVPEGVLRSLAPVEVDGEMAERFFQRHVLEPRRWHHPTYFRRRSKGDFTPTGRPLGRLFPSHAHLQYWYGRHGETGVSYPALYARRMRRMAAPLLRGQLLTDEHLHRWVESLDRASEEA